MGYLFCCGGTAGSQLIEAAKLGDGPGAARLITNNPSVARKAQKWGEPWHLLLHKPGQRVGPTSCFSSV